jgi:hypothetical protein
MGGGGLGGLGDALASGGRERKPMMTGQMPYDPVLAVGLFADGCKWWSIVMLIPVPDE